MQRRWWPHRADCHLGTRRQSAGSLKLWAPALGSELRRTKTLRRAAVANHRCGSPIPNLKLASSVPRSSNVRLHSLRVQRLRVAALMDVAMPCLGYTVTSEFIMAAQAGSLLAQMGQCTSPAPSALFKTTATHAVPLAVLPQDGQQSPCWHLQLLARSLALGEQRHGHCRAVAAF